MAIIHIISFVMIAFTAGYLLKQHLSDMLPFVWCGLILVLYVLAFFKGLSTIDIIMPVVALILVLFVRFKDKTRWEEFVAYAKESVISVPFIVYAICAVVICFCVSSKVVTWWDDINYWASDLKSLYYLNGFADKYANVSPEFADYPPGVQLAKWFAAHMNRTTFSEGAAFAGYYLFGLSFMMPIFKNISSKKAYLTIPLAIATWFFAGIADKYGYAGFCADLSMAYIWGAVLIETYRYNENDGVIKTIRVGFYLAVLVLCKSTGAIWALFALIIWCTMRAFYSKKAGIRKMFEGMWVAIFPFVTGLTWLMFCLLRHRVTKTTTTAITYITTDDYSISFYTADFAKAFVKAFFTEPIHVDHVGIIVPPAAMIVSFIAAFFFLYKKGYIEGRAAKYEIITLPVIGIIYYGVIFIAHITIFATETQYLEPEAMIASIERYGAPFIIGTLMLISCIWFDCAHNTLQTNTASKSKMNDEIRVLFFLAVVLILTNIPAAYDSLIGYRSHIDEDIQTRNDFLDEESGAFLNVLNEKLPGGNTRVCRIHDGGYYRVNDTYVAYEASPTSVMTLSYDLISEDVDIGSLIYAINQTHATFLYVDKQMEESKCLDELTPDNNFKYRTLYYISYEDGGMVLYEQ